DRQRDLPDLLDAPPGVPDPGAGHPGGHRAAPPGRRPRAADLAGPVDAQPGRHSGAGRGPARGRRTRHLPALRVVPDLALRAQATGRVALPRPPVRRVDGKLADPGDHRVGRAAALAARCRPGVLPGAGPGPASPDRSGQGELIHSSVPSRNTCRFHTGRRAFTSSTSRAQAANAASRCAVATAATSATSPMLSSPTRCETATA